MTSSQRSTLRLDLKDLAPESSTPHIGRLGLVAISVVAVVSAVISINSPSASVANVDNLADIQADKPEDAAEVSQAMESISQPDSATTAEPNALLESAGNKVEQPASDNGVDKVELVSLAPTAGTTIPGILQSTPEGRKEAVNHGEARIHLASLAPVIPRESVVPLVNLIEADPVAEIDAQGDIDTEIALPEEDAGIEPATTVAAIHPAPVSSTTEDQVTVRDELPAIEPVVVDAIEPVEAIDPLQQALTEGDWQSEKVRKNDTISQLFNRVGISSREAYALVELEHASTLNRIRPGQEIEITTRAPKEGSEQLRLGKLKYKIDRFTTMLVQGTDEGYSVDIVEREPEVRYRTVQATIWSSLLGAAKKAEIPFDVVYSLATIFGWQVDFAKDIQSGDSFTAIYEELYLDDELIDSGQVVAAELITGERNLRAVRHVDEDNRVTYYAPDGEGIQGSFLRSPLKFARVTSKFSNRRLHPIKKVWKAHKGVDYGAAMNTPIRSTGDGVVKFVGTKNGYGKTVILRHGEKYQTLYAHMNKFKKGMRAGSRVKQGDVIGYVGRTGWATGPHLHYEFQVAGNHVNPLTVELPKSLPIDKQYREAFKQEASTWVARLEEAGQIPLAQNER